MKRVFVMAAALTLAACSPSAPEAPAEPEAEAETAAADMTAWEGSYDLAYEDGSESRLTITADGGYTLVTGDETQTGIITMGEAGAFCYTAAGGTETECWTNGEVAEDGSWVSTSDQGRSVTVTRLEG